MRLCKTFNLQSSTRASIAIAIASQVWGDLGWWRRSRDRDDDDELGDSAHHHREPKTAAVVVSCAETIRVLSAVEHAAMGRASVYWLSHAFAVSKCEMSSLGYTKCVDEIMPGASCAFNRDMRMLL